MSVELVLVQLLESDTSLTLYGVMVSSDPEESKIPSFTESLSAGNPSVLLNSTLPTLSCLNMSLLLDNPRNTTLANNITAIKETTKTTFRLLFCIIFWVQLDTTGGVCEKYHHSKHRVKLPAMSVDSKVLYSRTFFTSKYNNVCSTYLCASLLQSGGKVSVQWREQSVWSGGNSECGVEGTVSVEWREQ